MPSTSAVSVCRGISGPGAIGRSLLAMVLLLFVMIAAVSPANAQSDDTGAAEQNAPLATAPATEATASDPVADAASTPAPILGEQEAASAFAEANATAEPQPAVEPVELNDEPTDRSTDSANGTANTSYGSFLDRKEEPVNTSIMETGDSLVSSMFTTIAALCLVLGLIFLAVWLLRRFGPRGISRPKDLVNPQLVGRLSLDPKNRVDVIRVQGRTLLLGVTEANVSLLTELETQPGQCFDEEDEDEFTDFTEMLGKKIDSADAD